MPDYLSTKDWRKLLDDKDHKTVKKTGVSDTFDEYAAAAKKDDLARMASALQAVISKANEVKTAQKKFPKIVDFLENTVSAAKGEIQKLGPRLAQLEDDADDEGDGGTLGKALTKVRQITDPEKAWNFILVPGKPSAGFVVVKKTPKKSHIDTAFEMRGKRGPFFQGKIYFEAGRYVLETPEQPVPGSAKAAKNAALLHAEMNIKVTMRGGGVSLFDEADREPEDEGGVPTPQTDDQNQRTRDYDKMIEAFDHPVDILIKDPSVKKEGAIDGLNGRLNLLRDRIDKDPAVIPHDKTVLLGKIDTLKKSLFDAARTPAPSPKSAYPDRAYWQRLAEGIVKLDQSKHDDAWKRFLARYDDVLKQWTGDTALVDPDREEVRLNLAFALTLAENRLNQRNKLDEQRDETIDPKVTQRFLALERKLDTIRSTPGLNPQQVNTLINAFGAIRTAYEKGTLTLKSPELPKLEQAMENVLKLALAEREKRAKLQGQAQVHNTLKPAMELVKRAAFPNTLISDPNAIREAVKKDRDLLALIQAGAEATKKHDAPSFANLEKAARTMLEAVETRAKDGDVLPSDAEAKRIATEALKRVQLGKMALEYATLGDPPWDESKSEKSLELQSQLFFVESAIAKGDVNYTAPSTSGQGGGASGSWWIERGEAQRGVKDAPKTTKKYIFKPGKKEAAVMTGLPPGSGAPREVLAKKVSDTMSGAGFNVGVSPTTLATIDSSQLGGEIDPKGGPLVGSIQQLAPSDGAIVEKMLKDPKFAATIDKRNFDDVAVFDMVFANLDRHGKNILTTTDEVTGKTSLVPIDHGSALADPEDVYANRGALMPSFNIMANDDLPQGQLPLGDETVEALNRLDPDKMLQDMKNQRDDLARRHPETAGTVSDAALEGMAARVRFLKIVGNSVPVQVLFVMLADGARDIAKCKPEDMPELAKSLRAAAERKLEGAKSIRKVADDMKEISASSYSIMMQQLQALGWGWNLTMREMQDWAETNAELVSRVLKGQIVNPDFQDEFDRLLVEAKKHDTDKKKIEDEIKGSDRASKMMAVYKAANPQIFGTPERDMDLPKLQNEFDRLGGDTEMAKIVRVFPAEGRKTGPIDPSASDREKRFAMIDRVELLRQWSEFNKLGGIKALLDQGQLVAREYEVISAIQTLYEATKRAKATGNVLAMDPGDIDKAQVKAYEKAEKVFDDDLDKIIDPRPRNTVKKLGDSARDKWLKGDRTSGGAMMAYVAKQVTETIASETAFALITRGRRDDLFKAIEKDENGTQKLAPHRARLFGMVEDSAKTNDVSKGENAINEIKSILDEVTLGDEAPVSKAKKEFEEAKRKLDPYKDTPMYVGMKIHLDRVADRIATFDFSSLLKMDFEGVDDRLKAAKPLLDACGGKPFNQLPETVQTILQQWVDLHIRYDIGKARDDARKIEELLADKVN